MNLLLLEPAEVEGETIRLGGRRAEHLRQVLRVAVDDDVRVGVIRGGTGLARVLRTGEVVELALGPLGPPPSPPRTEVILAVPRPKVLPRTLEIIASFGVARVDLVNAWRVDKSYLGSHRVGEAELVEALRRGCEQGAHTWVPEIALHPLLVPFLERELPSRLADVPLRLLADPGAPAVETVARGRARLVVAVGPEGGWIDSERRSFAALGFERVSLGPAVLRVEAAVAALLAQLDLLARL